MSLIRETVAWLGSGITAAGAVYHAVAGEPRAAAFWTFAAIIYFHSVGERTGTPQ